MKLDLVIPGAEHKELWYDIVKEFKDANEKVVPHALTCKLEDYDEYLQKTYDNRNDINLGPYVPATTYFLMDENKDRILGAISIRHRLNEDLLFRGGHIGYGVRPTQRKKGYATQMLHLALEECRKMGLMKVLITCNKDNIGSAKTIQNNGGVMENEVTEENGNIVQRYWIDLK